MRLYDGTCVADENGVLECCCRFCTALRVLAVEEFVEADKMRRQLFPGASYEVRDDVYEPQARATGRHKKVRCAS